MNPIATTMNQSRQRTTDRARNLERLKAALPQWYEKATSVVDHMLCCSYSDRQAFAEEPDLEYSEDNSLADTIWWEEFQKTRQPHYYGEEVASPTGSRFLMLDARRNRAVFGKDLNSCEASTCNTVSTASMNSRSQFSTHSWHTVPTFESSFADEREQAPSEISVPTRSVPRSKRSVRSKESPESIHEAALMQVSKNIRKVQNESLADLPFLSANAGFRI